VLPEVGRGVSPKVPLVSVWRRALKAELLEDKELGTVHSLSKRMLAWPSGQELINSRALGFGPHLHGLIRWLAMSQS
jgi:hypothetical protein